MTGMANHNENSGVDSNREPIEDIEHTVEDLKKKIQEISDRQTQEETSDPEIPHFAETRQKIAEIRESAVESVTRSIEDAKHAADNACSNEDLQKTLSYIRENARQAVDNARGRIDALRRDEQVQKNILQAKGKAAAAVDSVSKAAKEAADSASVFISSRLTDEQAEKLSRAKNEAGRIASETAKNVSSAVDELIASPEVQQFQKKTADLAEKGLNRVKNFFSGKN